MRNVYVYFQQSATMHSKCTIDFANRSLSLAASITQHNVVLKGSLTSGPSVVVVSMS